MDDQTPEISYGMEREEAQALHESIGKALAADNGEPQSVTISIRRETVERLQISQSQGLPQAGASAFGTGPLDEGAE